MNDITFHPDVPQKVQEFVHKLVKIRSEIKEEMEQLMNELYPEPESDPHLGILFAIAHQEPGEYVCRVNLLAQGNMAMIEAGLKNQEFLSKEGGEG